MAELWNCVYMTHNNGSNKILKQASIIMKLFIFN